MGCEDEPPGPGRGRSFDPGLHEDSARLERSPEPGGNLKSLVTSMELLDGILQKVVAEVAGFKTKASLAETLFRSYPTEACLELARCLLLDNRYQVRELAVFLLGNLSARSGQSLATMKDVVSLDENWRVQEILAKAFDRFCSDTGYEKSVPTIKAWLDHDRPNVRRAVTEGLRIWTNRDYFKTHPEVALGLLANLRFDPSAYVRKSVGNALRDISKKHPGLVCTELQRWKLLRQEEQQVHGLASKFLVKEKPR